MKRSKVIRLVLLGGGVSAMLAACGDDRRLACERARAELRPDAEEICRRSGSSSSSSSASTRTSWTSGKSAGDAGSSTVSGTSHGGFGSSAHAFSSGG